MTTIKIRRDTAANWTAANPVLALAEPGLETDTGRIKYGDGNFQWLNLPYARGSVSVVNRSVAFPQGVAGDTAGTIANDEGTLYFSTADYVTQEPTSYSFTSTETVLNSQDINGNMNFSFTIADNPSLAAALYNISVANGSVQLSSPALDGVRTTAPGVMNYNNDNTTFGIQVPYQSGDPTEIDIGTPFTVTLTLPQPAIWEHISTTGTGNITFSNNIISTAQGQVIDIKTTTSSGDGNELFIGSDNIDLYVFNNTQGSGAELYLNNTNHAQPYAYIGVQPHNGSEQYWTFNPDGSIVFPDTTVQTTAYPGPTNVDPHIWAVQATSTTKYSNTQAVAYDSQGNSFALMAQGPQSGGGEYRSSIIKLDAEGNKLWAIELTDGQEVDPWSLVCDANNDVYAVVAHYVNSIYNNTVIKLSGSNGSILWQIDIQDSQNAKNMQAVPFTVSGQPGIIVAGTAYNGTDNDFFIVFIQADGTVPIPASLWGDQYDQQAYSVATDSTGDILLVGVKKDVADNAYYLEMAKFTYGTGIVWQKSVTVDGNYDVKGTDVCLLADGNWAIIATHQIDNTGNTWGIITMKVNNTDGTVMWSREVNAGCSGISSSIASDAAGNIYISATTFTGDTSTNGGNIPIAARLYAAYNSSGTSLWQKYLRCPGNNWVVDNNWWNGIGSTGKLIAVYNDKLLLGFSQSPLNPYPGATTGVIAQLTLLGENETIGPFSTSNSYLSDSAITLTLADTTFNFSTGPQTFATGTSISTGIATLTYNKFNAGATPNRLATSGQSITLQQDGSLVDGNSRNILGEFEGVTDSGNNFSNIPIGIRNASGYKRLVGLTNSAQTWFDINTVATQLGVNPAWIMGLTVEYQVTSSNLNYNGSMTGQIIIASSNNSSWNISVSHSEAVLTQSNSSSDIVFANLNLWQPSGWTLQAIRTDSNSQQLDIIWTAKVFINASEAYC